MIYPHGDYVPIVDDIFKLRAISLLVIQGRFAEQYKYVVLHLPIIHLNNYRGCSRLQPHLKLMPCLSVSLGERGNKGKQAS